LQHGCLFCWRKQAKIKGESMDMSEVVAELRALRLDVQDVREEIAGYKSFVSGVAWCLSGIAGLVGFVWGLIFAG
jgi:hypothetical protein